MGLDIVWDKFKCVLEVLLCFSSVSTICKEGGKVDTSTKMLSIVEEALFEEIDSLFVVFTFFLDNSRVEVGVYVGNGLLDGSVVEFSCFVNFTFLFIDLA